jgi:titin
VQGTNLIGGDNASNYFTRNFLSGNGKDGLLIDGSGSANRVQGNFIGVDVSGTNGVGNVANGVEIAGTSNTIGGTTGGLANVISGNKQDGILLDSTASANLVLGNKVGTDYTGHTAVANSGNGVEVAGSTNTVGASYAVGPNVLSGNSKAGVRIDKGASGNAVLGNYIGTNYSGTVALANQVGIEDAGQNNTLGGSVLGARNVLSGNSGDGILLDSSATGETVQGNYIGLNYNGKTALANGSNGVEVQGSNNLIGGNSGSNYYVRNFISGNTGDGLLIANGATGNLVQGNFIG